MRGRSSGKTAPPVPGLTRVGGGAIKINARTSHGRPFRIVSRGEHTARNRGGGPVCGNGGALRPGALVSSGVRSEATGR
jgi:hypothetical protein